MNVRITAKHVKSLRKDWTDQQCNAAVKALQKQLVCAMENAADLVLIEHLHAHTGSGFVNRIW